MNASLTHIYELLRTRNRRMTKQKRLILEVLFDSQMPMTASEIHQSVEKKEGADLATVYRNLEAFVADGVVEPTESTDKGVAYSVVGRGHSHTLVCSLCDGRTVVRGCLIASAMGQLEQQTGFRHIRHTLTLYGECPQCQGNCSKA